MSLTPVIYVDNQTVIGASNLNAIQDAILANEQGLANKVNTTDYNPNAKTSDMNQPVGKDGSGKLWTKLIGGPGLVIKGYYPTLSDLQEAVPNPSLGDAYGVGTSAPYYIYVWSGTSWVDNGTLVSVASVNNQLGVVQLDGADINVDDTAATPVTIKNKITQQSSDIVALTNTVTSHSSQIVLQSQNLEATQDIISDAYDNSIAYTTGNLVIYNNQLYVRLSLDSGVAGYLPTDTSHWSASTINAQIGSINSDLANNYIRRINFSYPTVMAYLGDGESIDVPNVWFTYLVISCYSGQFGMWLTLPQGSITDKIGGSYSGSPCTSVPGRITSNVKSLLVIKVGRS